MRAEEFKSCVDAVRHCCKGGESYRYTLNVVHIAPDGDGTRFTATDGRRLATTWHDSQLCDWGERESIMLRHKELTKVVNQITKLAKGGNLAVAISDKRDPVAYKADTRVCGEFLCSWTHYGKKTEARIERVPILDGRFPRWQDVVDNAEAQTRHNIEATVEEYQDFFAIDSVEVTASGDEITLSRRAPRAITFNVADSEVDCEAINCLLNTQYVQDAFRRQPVKETVSIGFTSDSGAPVLVKGTHTTQVIMPMARD